MNGLYMGCVFLISYDKLRVVFWVVGIERGGAESSCPPLAVQGLNTHSLNYTVQQILKILWFFNNILYYIICFRLCWFRIWNPIYYITSQFENIQPAKLQNYQGFRKELSNMAVTIKTCLSFRFIAYLSFAKQRMSSVYAILIISQAVNNILWIYCYVFMCNFRF